MKLFTVTHIHSILPDTRHYHKVIGLCQTIKEGLMIYGLTEIDIDINLIKQINHYKEYPLKDGSYLIFENVEYDIKRFREKKLNRLCNGRKN